MKFLNDVTITGSGADLSCAATVTFSNLPDSTETVSVMINSSGVLSKRALAAAAFKGAANPTENDTDNVALAGGVYTFVTEYALPIGTTTTKWNGGATGLTASTGRTSLGATTVGSNLFTLTNPGAIRFPRINANSTVSSLSAADFRTAIGVSDGDGGLTEKDFTEALKTKLDSLSVLAAASTTVLGGVKLKTDTLNGQATSSLTTTNNRTYVVQKSSATGNPLVVNVPWSSGVSDASEIDDATTEARGIMSASDKSKLDEIAAGATANVGDVTLTGAQTLSGAKTLSAALAVSDSTASTSKTTGAVKITGGVGIQGALNVGGDVIAFASSDERYKDNLQAIKNPIDKVKNLTGYTFTWNDKHEQFNGNNDIGVVAQEVEKVLPEIVDTRDKGYKAVKYEKMVALLIEAVKDQQKQIDELKYILHGRPE